jgi:uncharacterized membrane protein
MRLYLLLLCALVWLGETAVYGQATAAMPVLDPAVPSVTPLSDKIGLAILIPWVIEQMKTSRWRIFDWIGPYSTRVARMLSLVGAATATAGIIVRYDPTAETLLLTHVSVSSLALLLFELVKQFAMQEAAYRSAFKTPTS